MGKRTFLTIDATRNKPNEVIQIDLNNFGDPDLGWNQDDLESVVKLEVNDHICLDNQIHVIRIQ